MGFHACQSAIYQNIRLGNFFSQSVFIIQAEYLNLTFRSLFFQLLRCLMSSLKKRIIRIKNRNRSSSVKGALYLNGCSCSACSKNHHFLSFYLNSMLLQVLYKTSSICNMTYKLPVLIYNGVYCSNNPCCR